MAQRETMQSRSADPAAREMLARAREMGVETAWDRYEAMQPQCGFGELGTCCRNCNMGPCRISPFEGEGPRAGICGATADIIVARNLLRMIAAGAAAHSDHGRDVARTLLATAEGRTDGYTIRDEAKLRTLAAEYGIPAEGRGTREVALELARAVCDEFDRQEAPLRFAGRAAAKRAAVWRQLGIEPRGIDREIVESLHRTNMGVDSDPVNLVLQGLRTALADGWGGSMIATELSDVLFGTPAPARSAANLGVLREDEVNILVHGHEPVLSDTIVEASRDPELLALAAKHGAKGINVAGLCCTGNEVLMRHGIPAAGNFLQQELALLTGAVETMVVDVQCVMPSLGTLAGCFHTKLVSTSPKAKFPGAVHVEFHEERAGETARAIVRSAVENFRLRKPQQVQIPAEKTECLVGFSVEAVVQALGGSLEPLLGAIKSGAVRGIAAVVGCNNVKVRHDDAHRTLVRELIAHDVLVVTTGCNAIACAKDGLLLPEAAALAGDGLRSVCRALGTPPVLHMGSCVDISRILVTCSAIADALGVDVSDLPVAAAAPEWTSEKAVSIGAYAGASGITTVLGTVPPVLGGPAVASLLTQGAKDVVGAAFAVEPDPAKAARFILDHIAAKRTALGL